MSIQEDFFNEWNNKCLRLKDLSGFFQNDIDKLLQDDLISKEDIWTNMREFDILYNEALGDIQNLYCKIHMLMLKKGM